MTATRATIGVDANGRATRTLIVGRTQSGKSTLVAQLVAGYRSLVVIDHKRQFELPRTVVVTGPAAFRQAWPQKARRVIYRPDPYAKRGADVGEVIGRVLSYGRTALVVDEAMNLCTQGWILPEYRRSITEGASLFVPVFSVTQRPVGIHNVLLTEADDVFVFDLAGPSDRDKVAGHWGQELLERPIVPYSFAYAGLSNGWHVVSCPPLQLVGDQRPAADRVDSEVSGGPSDARQPVHGDAPGRGRDPRQQVRPLQVPGARAV